MRSRLIACHCLVAAAVCLASTRSVSNAAENRIVFEQDFSKIKDGTTATDLRWTLEAAPDESLYAVENGALGITCFHKPYKGGSICRQIPVIHKGRLEFDASIGDANNDHFSLMVSLYSVMTSFKGYGSYRINWDRYCPEFDIRKIKYPWAGIADRISPDTMHHFAVEFDADRPRIEYFVDDMEDPVFIDTEVPLPKEGVNTLRLGNYGLCSGTVFCNVKSIKLTESDAVEETGDRGKSPSPHADRDRDKRPLVVDGVGFAPYHVDEALSGAGAPKAKHYLMELGLGLQPKVETRLARLIGARSLSSADLVVLNDVTATCLGTELVNRLEEWVKEGGSLLVLGGYFTFGKGGFKGTPLEAMMPVELIGPWEVKQAATPLILHDTGESRSSRPLDWSAKPSAFYYHDLKPKPGSRVMVGAGKVPMISMWSYGKGKVAAFAGTTAGLAPPGTLPFWEWKDWPSLLAAVVRELRGEAR